MTKIKDLEVGQKCTLTLVVLSATARETKAKKPYLSLEFFDGTDKIISNYWDWSGKAIPSKNTILDVSAQVSEWQGVKQLQVQSLSTNTTMELGEFMPKSLHDIPAAFKEACDLMGTVSNEDLRTLANSALQQLEVKWLAIPGARGIHHAYTGGTLIHSLSVARIAEAIAVITPGANRDLCIVGGMLHDIGKLFTYVLDGVTIGMTDEGMLYDHLFMGAEMLGNMAENVIDVDDDFNAKMLEALRHILLSHHGRLDYGAVVTPASMEAHIVHHADAVDAACEQIRDASNKLQNVKWTEKIWALENKPHLTTQYVDAVMSRKSKS